MLERKHWIKGLLEARPISITLSCEVTGISRTVFYYQAKRPDDSDIIDALNLLVKKHQRWGFPRRYKRLCAIGYALNHKRVCRVYSELKLSLRRKGKKRLPARNPEALAISPSTGKTWSMDFINLQEVMKITENWMKIYNTERPHDSLNGMTPIQYKLTT